MKTKFVLSLLTALLFNFATSGLFAQSIGVDHTTMFGIQMALSLVPLHLTGCLADGLNKEIWIPGITEKFFPESSFINEARNFDAWVDNNAINLQEAGIDPRVFVDNEVYPIPIVVREDTPQRIELKRFDTENTVHINAIEIEESTGKRESVIEGHRRSLQLQFSQLAAHNWAPTKDTPFTPVLKAKGEASALGTGYKRITYADILALETAYNMMSVPKEGRVLVLHPYHVSDLQLQDMDMYKTFFSTNRLFNFKVEIYSETPRFNGATGVKLAWNAPVSATDAIASFAYHKDSVCRAKGTADMYYRLNDPEYRGDIVGFNMRGIALPINGKYLGAIYSTKS